MDFFTTFYIKTVFISPSSYVLSYTLINIYISLTDSLITFQHFLNILEIRGEKYILDFFI